MNDKARFLTGSTMRHVMVMTITGSLGLVFMFLVDVATLFWVSLIGVERLVAALGFAWTVQFFTISSGIGFMIAATALVSRSIGKDQLELARRQATISAVYTTVVQLIVAIVVVIYRREILAFAGAEGQTLDDAARFLLISVPSLPLMALGMASSAVLRSIGDAVRSMAVTMSAGFVAMIIDPFLIFTLDLGLEGAAWGVFISRSVSALLGLWFVWRVHDMYGPMLRSDLVAMAKPFTLIALPAVATQMSTPFGNYILTKAIAAYGDGAVAGWAVISRVSVLAFGGLFSLSGAVGGILGQNYGAGYLDRVRSTFRDAIIFCVVYTLLAWTILILMRHPTVALFGLTGEGAEVLLAFMSLAAGGFVFAGALFVANSAFNNLGKPVYSTICNWLRDGIFMYPCAALLGGYAAAPGVVYGQAVATILAGGFAVYWAWRFVGQLKTES